MSETFNALINRVAQELLANGTTDVDTVCDVVAERHPEAVEAHGQALARDGLRRRVKTLFRHMSEDDTTQMALPGLSLPSAIAVPVEGGIEYVRADKATWTQLLAGRDVRHTNVSAAREKLRHYDQTLERLRPLMEHFPERAVADALRAEAS